MSQHPQIAARSVPHPAKERTTRVTDQPRTPVYPVQVSVPGTRTEDGADCTLLAIRERSGTWMIHSLNQGAASVRTEVG